MTPNMQGVIMAIGKSGSVYDKCGPEAAFFKVHDLLHATPPVHRISSSTTPPPWASHYLCELTFYTAGYGNTLCILFYYADKGSLLIIIIHYLLCVGFADT